MLTEEEKQLAKVVLQKGAVTEDRLKEALTAKKGYRDRGMDRSLEEILLEKNFLTRDALDKVKPSQAPPVVKKVAGYEILEKLGHGGMGAVYKARQVSMDRVVALKILSPRLARDKAFLERFQREARSTGLLNHPNIVHGIDVGEADGFYYFSMEFVDGQNLQDLLKQKGRLEEDQALRIALQMAQALDYAHGKGIVHRDMKPANILLQKDGVAKLLDLGLARETGEGDVTQAGVALGTPFYISPEQARGEAQIDIRSDIYSLGATLYHLVTGEVPFQGTTAAVIMTKHLTEDLPSPLTKRADLSPSIVAVILKMMAREPSGRYAAPADLVKDIQAVQRGETPEALKAAAAAPAPAKAPGARPARPRPAVRALAPAAAAAPKNQTARLAGAFILTLLGVLLLGLLALKLLGGGGGGGDNKITPIPPDPGPNASTTQGTGPGGATGAVPPGGEKPPAAADESEKALRLAADYANRNSGRFRETVEKFEGVARRFPGTKAAEEAGRKAEEFKEEARTRAEAAFNAAKSGSVRETGDGNFIQALALLDQFDRTLDLEGTFGKQIEEEKAVVRISAKQHFTAEVKRAQAAKEGGKFDEASKIYAGLIRAALEEDTKILRSLMEALDADRKAFEGKTADAEKRRLEEAARRAAQALEEARKLLAEVREPGNYKAKRDRVLEALGAVQDPQIKKDLTEAAQELKLLAAYEEKFPAVLQGLVGKAIEGGKGIPKGKVVKVDGETIHIDQNALLIKKAFKDLSGEAGLALLQLAGGADKEVLGGYGLSLLAADRFDDAGAVLEKALVEGRDRFLARARSGVAGKRKEEIGRKLVEIEAAAAAGKMAAAREELARIRGSAKGLPKEILDEIERVAAKLDGIESAKVSKWQDLLGDEARLNQWSMIKEFPKWMLKESHSRLEAGKYEKANDLRKFKIIAKDRERIGLQRPLPQSLARGKVVIKFKAEQTFPSGGNTLVGLRGTQTTYYGVVIPEGAPYLARLQAESSGSRVMARAERGEGEVSYEKGRDHEVIVWFWENGAKVFLDGTEILADQRDKAAPGAVVDHIEIGFYQQKGDLISVQVRGVVGDDWKE